MRLTRLGAQLENKEKALAPTLISGHIYSRGTMNFKRTDNPQEILDVLRYHSLETGYCVFDFETTSLNPRQARLLDIQMMGIEPDSVLMFDGKHLPLLKTFTGTHVFHNFRYDWHVAYAHGVDFRGRNVLDTMLLHHLLDENSEHGLDSIVQSKWQDPYKEIFWGKYKTYEEASDADKLDYACKDIVYTRKLFVDMEEGLAEIPSQLVEHAHRLALALFDTEIRGLNLDIDYLAKLGVEYQSKIDSLLPRLRECVLSQVEAIEFRMWEAELDKRKTDAGKARVPKPEFSFDSSKQLKDLLYTELQLPVQVNDKTKSVSTDDAALENLKDAHPVIPLLREYRDAKKILSTYIEGILDKQEAGRIYPSFNVNGTATGRISHSNPNMGNWPSGGGIRKAIVPDPGNVFIGADYSQLEVCLAAHFSRDKALLEIVEQGKSQHDITAAALGIERQVAKTINFAMQYRCSHFKLMKILGVSEEEAKAVHAKYWETYSGLRRLMAQCDAKVNKGIPITNPFGRKRRFEPGKKPEWAKEYRQAFNALIQGTGGDLTNRAFYLVSEELKKRGWGHGLFTIHDEVLIEVKEEFAVAAEELLVYTMKQVGKEINLTVELKVEASGPMKCWED